MIKPDELAPSLREVELAPRVEAPHEVGPTFHPGKHTAEKSKEQRDSQPIEHRQGADRRKYTYQKKRWRCGIDGELELTVPEAYQHSKLPPAHKHALEFLGNEVAAKA